MHIRSNPPIVLIIAQMHLRRKCFHIHLSVSIPFVCITEYLAVKSRNSKGFLAFNHGTSRRTAAISDIESFKNSDTLL